MEAIQHKTTGPIGSVPRCRSCGSERVVRDAWACWNVGAGLWELEATFDLVHCHVCEGETTLEWSQSKEPLPGRIRELNDRLRMTGQGNGSILVTSGVQDEGAEFVVAAVEAVRQFDGFGEDNDPWHEHDFGAVEIGEEKIFFKIDYYNPDCTAGSENPANEGETHRVLTIMLASEY